ncbi:hypothetical protein HMI54_001904 [Coelomomyces lativittatus]|nr:hypothetical protein HMI54_001904 [Coelomomyces lativittatus]
MRKKRKVKSGNSNQTENPKTNRIPYEDIELHNEHFETYYRAQKILPEEEWTPFLEHCKSTLPITFRFTGSNDDASKLSQLFLDTFFSSKDSEPIETSLPIPTEISWYPGIAWQMDVSRSIVRKSDSYKRFHQFLMTETELGHIARQEAVSMLPPLFLQMEPHHQVIDLCAAPGSKTAQLLELVHSENGGLVVANDADSKRAYTLVHQLKRTQSPHLLVTYHAAQHFPSLASLEHPDVPIQFDRVLADVPCCGDGTLRKNGLIWRTWKPDQGLHVLQCRILMRGIQLAKVGGKIVYSTCTMNPIENEAVIASILQRCQGKVTLTDVSHILPSLLRRSGLSQWKVPSTSDPSLLYSQFSEVSIQDRRRITASYFPPNEDLGLHKCVRIYPHLQNTGGFFLAVLEKLGEPDLHGRSCFGELPDDLPLRTIFKRRFYSKTKLKTNDANEGENENEIQNVSETEVENKNHYEEIQSGDTTEMNYGIENSIQSNDSEAPLILETSPAPLIKKSDSLEPLDGSMEHLGSLPNEETIQSISQPMVSTEIKATEELDSTERTTISTKQVEGHMNQEHFEDPFLFLNENDEELKSIRSTFGVSEEFPFSQLLVRSMSLQHRAIYFCSKSIKNLLQSRYAYKLKVVHTGVKVFVRAHEQSLSTHRFSTEGIHLMAPFVSKQIIHINHDVLIQLLVEDRPLLYTLPKLFEHVQKGGVIFKYHQFCLSGWLAPCSVGLLVNKKERESLLFRFRDSSSSSSSS